MTHDPGEETQDERRISALEQRGRLERVSTSSARTRDLGSSPGNSGEGVAQEPVADETAAEARTLRLRQAIADLGAGLEGTYPPGYLEDLRNDWPD